MKLTEMKLLSGQTEEITMTDLRSRPGDVIDQVRSGKSFVVTKAGKKVAVIMQPELNAFELGAAVRRMERAKD